MRSMRYINHEHHKYKLHIVSCDIRRSMTSPRLFLKIVPALRSGLHLCDFVASHVHYLEITSCTWSAVSESLICHAVHTSI